MRNIPSKSERDDGGSKPIGVFGLLFGIVIYAVFMYTIVSYIGGQLF